MSQQSFAQAIGATLDRVKNMTSGRVSKLHPEETRMLVEEFGVRGDYLATGTGPVLARQGTESRQSVQRDVDELAIPMSYKRPVRDLVAAVALRDGDMAMAAIGEITQAALARAQLGGKMEETRINEDRPDYVPAPRRRRGKA